MEADGPAGVRYRRDVGRGASGVRVSLRRRLPGGALGDVLGQLLEWTEAGVVVERRDGTTVSVPEADVVAVKVVGPPPTRRP